MEVEKLFTQISLPELLVRKYTLMQRTYNYSIDNIWEMMLACRNESMNANAERNFNPIVK
jgi:hypothetical protein